jgi:hypothetical protein
MCWFDPHVPRDQAGASDAFCPPPRHILVSLPTTTTTTTILQHECVLLCTSPCECTDTGVGYNGYETSYTSYGATGGAGGGGFIPGDGSQQSPGGRKDHTQDSMRPVTIKQLLDAQVEPGSNDISKVDGAPVTQAHTALLLPATHVY